MKRGSRNDWNEVPTQRFHKWQVAEMAVEICTCQQDPTAYGSISVQLRASQQELRGTFEALKQPIISYRACRICFMVSNRAPSLVESEKTISISDWKALPFSPLHVG